MKIKMWLFLVALGFIAAAVVGLLANGSQVSETQTSQQVITVEQEAETRAPKTMVEIIADQIETGNASCPDDDLLTYETCLLFQGALGTWQRVGLQEFCPDIIGSHYPPPPPRIALSYPHKATKVTREVVERAVKTPCFGHLYAINVANTTPILVSTANRTFQMAVIPNFSKPGSDPELCLSVRHGICGNHAAVAIGFFERAGFEARAVEFYYDYEGSRLSHITPEVWIDGRWRLIDSTYGAYWVEPKPSSPFEIMPTDSVLAGNTKEIFYNTALLPFGFRSAIQSVNYFSYLTGGADVIRGGVGEISIDLKGEVGVEDFQHKKNYVGDNKPDGLIEGIKFKINATRNKYKLTVAVSGAAFSDTVPAFICIDDSCEQYSKDQKEYRFTVTKPSQLYLKSTADVAYVVMKSLEWKVVND